MNSDLKKIVSSIIRAGFWVVPFIPLYISAALFFPYITGKAFVFRAIVEAGFFTWLWLAIFYGEYRPKLSGLMLAVSAWLLVAAAATALGVNPMKSFWSNFERMEGLVTYIHLWAFFVVIGSVFKKKDWMLFMNLFLVSGIYENVYVLFQKLGFLASPQGGFRTDGTIGNPAYLAAYLLFIFGMAMILWFNSARKSAASYFYIAMAVWTLVSIYFTASRGPVIGLLMGLLLGAIAYLVLKNPTDIGGRYVKKIVGIGLVLLFIIPGSLWLARDTDFIKNNLTLQRFTSLSFSDRTITSRFTIWSMSLEAVKDRPILGWGPENYVVVFSKYFKPELWMQEPWFDRSHNIIFDWLINAGILGLASYLSIFAVAGYMIWKNFRSKLSSLEENIFIAAILFAYFFQNLFVFDNIATYIGFFSLLGYIHYVSISGNETVFVGKPDKKSKALINDDDGVLFGVTGGLLIALTAVLYLMIYLPLMTNTYLLGALKSQSANLNTSFDDFDQALLYGYLGRQEIREQLNSFALEVGGSSNVQTDFKDRVLKRAIAEDQSSILENPLDPRPYILAGGLYSKVGMHDEALKILDVALKLSPNKQQIYFEIADAYLQIGDYKNAVVVLEKAFMLDPSFNFARYNLSAVYILNRQQDRADQLLIEGFGTVNVADKILLGAYSKMKNYPRLIATWEAFVKNDPSLDNRTSLAGAYMLSGDNTDAIRVLQEAMSEFPAFQNQGAAYISQIKAGGK